MSEEDRILKEVAAAFELAPRIDLDHYPVRIRFNDNTLTLEGIAENVAAKKLMLELGVSLPVVTGIIDRLSVAARAQMSDAQIRDQSVQRLRSGFVVC